MYKQHFQCRACGSFALVEVFKFDRPMPLANDFVKPSDERQGFTPLRVMVCEQCSLAQLGETVNPEVLYKNYAYVTSRSQTMHRHFDRLCKDIISENDKGSIVEIGSNDGHFLTHALTYGLSPALGIDPAENLAGAANGIHQLVKFFDKTTALEAREMMPHPAHIVARHCFCHQEWKPFMQAIDLLAKKDTLISIEVPYAYDLIQRVEFDSIYQEHTSYLTLKSVLALLKDTPFHIHAVVRYGIHGGCVLIMLRHNDNPSPPHLSADEMMAEEKITMDSWKDFAYRARMKIANLQKQVWELREKGKIVCAFGASAKASVLINACGFTRDDIHFVTDNSPHKPGRLLPGTDILVIEEDQMLSEHPDYAIMTAWNYETEIIAKCAKWRARGGKFIVPDREIRIV